MPKRSVTMAQEFADAVEIYRAANHIKTWNQALVQLASERLIELGARLDAPPVAPWGGARPLKSDPAGAELLRMLDNMTPAEAEAWLASIEG